MVPRDIQVLPEKVTQEKRVTQELTVPRDIQVLPEKVTRVKRVLQGLMVPLVLQEKQDLQALILP
jgi:flagellin-specific chaperone FliS